MYICLFLFVSLSVYLSACSCIYLFIHVRVGLSVYLSAYLFISQSISPSLYSLFLLYLFHSNFTKFMAGNITFYRRLNSVVGQSPLTRDDQFDSAYSLRNTTEIGSCGFPVSYQEGIYPFNMSGHYIREIVPTSSPIKNTHSPTPVVKVHDEKKVYEYECLQNCSNYPGLNSLSTMNRQACQFLNTEIFPLCSSYSIINGLCSKPSCASSCPNDDYCFFGANAATICSSRRKYN